MPTDIEEALHEAGHAWIGLMVLGPDALKQVRLGKKPGKGQAVWAPDRALSRHLKAHTRPEQLPKAVADTARKRILLHLAGPYGEQLADPPWFAQHVDPTGRDAQHVSELADLLSGGDKKEAERLVSQMHVTARSLVGEQAEAIKRVAGELVARRKMTGSEVLAAGAGLSKSAPRSSGYES